MRLLVLLGISLLGLILASTVSLSTLAQPSEAEAKATFERLGCTACHRVNGIAEPWDEIVSSYKALSGKYASLDEFVEAMVSSEVKERLGVEVRTWNELFTTMARYAGKNPDDPGVKLVQNFLASLLGVKSPETPTPETPKPTLTPQTTTPTPAFVEERGVSFIIAAIVALVIVLAISLVAFWMSRR